jgi:serine protease AprX
MLKRTLFTLPVVALLVVSSGSVPSGQGTTPRLSGDLLTHAPGPHTHRVIVQTSDSGLQTLSGGGFGIVRGQLQGASVLEVNDAQLDALQHNSLFSHISGDLPVAPDLAVTNQVTQATSVWAGTPGLLGLLGTPGYVGNGVVVAVVDSGIAVHTALDSRVILHVNLVSNEPGVTGDPFGHGTHVAGIIGGNRTAATNVTTEFTGGSAPSVKFVDVRVLGSTGSGLTSDVINGINWVTAHAATYKIRVINLSLGHVVTEPSALDPLCQAVQRAVNAGITVVVSAGNYGLTSTGQPVLGGITSPGNSPVALTVGAIDTNGTVDPSDDVVAPYSSKGPTAYDLIVKPDVVAPGTKIGSLEAQNSYLSKTYPQWHLGGSGTNAYMRLSGTSMSTAVVTGGVALLLNAQPSLTPAQVKISIQMGARYMPQAGLIAAGTGSVNFEQSLKLANQGLLGGLLTTITNLLGLSSGATYTDNGALINGVYDHSGIRLLNLLDLSALFGEPGGGPAGVLNLLGSSNPIASTAPNYIVWGNVAGYSSSYYIVWGNTIQDPSGEYIVWGNSEQSDPNYIVWGNSTGGSH